MLDELFEWKHCGKEILLISIIVRSFVFLIVYIFLDCRNRNRFLGENVIGTKERGDSSCETKKEDEFQARRF